MMHNIVCVKLWSRDFFCCNFNWFWRLIFVFNLNPQIITYFSSFHKVFIHVNTMLNTSQMRHLHKNASVSPILCYKLWNKLCKAFQFYHRNIMTWTHQYCAFFCYFLNYQSKIWGPFRTWGGSSSVDCP